MSKELANFVILCHTSHIDLVCSFIVVAFLSHFPLKHPLSFGHKDIEVIVQF